MRDLNLKALEYIKRRDHTHFTKKAALRILDIFPNRDTYHLEAGFTPSGKVHLGNFGDIVIVEAVKKTLDIWGYNAESILVIDSRDPFRNAPTFAPEEFKKSSNKYLGMPLESLPDPWNCHKNYVEHFVEPLLNSLNEYGLKPKVYFAHQIHTNARYIELLHNVIVHRDRVARIFNEVHRRAGHKKRYEVNWIPFRPLCENCNRIDERVKPREILEDHYVIRYKCETCGHEGFADIRKAEGKAPWRIDWPLRWVLFDIHFEPMGKDLMAAGSSFDTGCALLREFFNREPPVAIFYDFFYWVEPNKEPKKFSKRAGVGFGAHEWLLYAPPEALNYMLLRRHVGEITKDSLRHIDFNPYDIPTYVNRYDSDEDYLFNKLAQGELGTEDIKMLMAYILSQKDAKKAFIQRVRRVPYDAALKAAMWMTDLEDGLRMLQKMGYLSPSAGKAEVEDAKERLRCALNYLRDLWIPPELDLKTILGSLPQNVRDAIRYILENTLKISPEELSQEVLREFVREASSRSGVPAKELYVTLYRIALGENEGPPAYRLYQKDVTRKNLIKAAEILGCSAVENNSSRI
ncbi:MAG: lysine--tRNA ligase [Crenarchaeota archaeon]|nr:lysine--tRNA ligase [Thermoproteota archaeon]